MSTATAGSDPDPLPRRPEDGFPELPASEGMFPAGEGSVLSVEGGSPSTHFGFPPSVGGVPSTHFILSSGEGDFPPTHFAFPSDEGRVPSSHFGLPSGTGRFNRHPSEPAESACPLPAPAGISPDDWGIPKTKYIALHTELIGLKQLNKGGHYD